MQPFVIVRSTPEGIVTSHFSELSTAFNSIDALPTEAKARLLGICNKHGITDYSDGYCADCYDEYCQRGQE